MNWLEEKLEGVMNCVEPVDIKQTINLISIIQIALTIGIIVWIASS